MSVIVMYEISHPKEPERRRKGWDIAARVGQ